MAVRIRADKETIVCAAKSEAQEGDIYIDDWLHYKLSVELRVLACVGQDDNGADLWTFGQSKREQVLETVASAAKRCWQYHFGWRGRGALTGEAIRLGNALDSLDAVD